MSLFAPLELEHQAVGASSSEPEPSDPDLVTRVGQAIPMRAWVVGGVAVFAGVYLFLSRTRDDVQMIRSALP